MPSTSKRLHQPHADHEQGRSLPDPSSPSTTPPSLLEQYQPQPLQPSHTTRLRTTANEYGPFNDQVLQAIHFLTETSAQAAEVHDADSEERLEELEKRMRGLIDLQAEIKLRRQAIEDIKQKLEQGDPIYDSPQRYKSCTEQALSEYRQRTSRTKYAQNPAYMQFREQIWEVSQTGAMPPITDLVPAEPGDEADSDEDLVVGGVMQDYKCPLSARILEDPLSSTVCKHSYSRREVMEYLAGNGGTARCPATGCDKVITRQNLKENRELRKRVAAYERREEEREIKRRGTQLTQVID